MKDFVEPEVVEIVIRDDGKVVWINVDGQCELRACKIKKLYLYDKRSKKRKLALVVKKKSG